MHFTCRSFIGSHSSTNWAQYWENEPDDPILANQKGHLFGLINLSSSIESENISDLGHDIIFEINQKYFSTNETNSVIANLEESLSIIDSNPLYHDYSKSIALVVVLQNQVYLAVYGSVSFVLNRGSKFTLLLAGKENEISTISGPILGDDKLLAITQNFIEKISLEKIKTIISDSKIQNIEENFLASLYSINDQTNLAAALIQAHHSTPDTLNEYPQEEIVTTIAPPIQTSFEYSTSTPSKPAINKNKYLSLIKNGIFNIKRLVPKKNIYISTHQNRELGKRKKLNLVIVILLIAGLSLSSYFGYQKNRKNQIEIKYQKLKVELDKKITDSLAVKNFNLDSALELAQGADSVYQQMSLLKVHSDELNQYQKQVQSLLSQTGSSGSFSPNLFYDTSLITDNPRYSKMIFKTDQLYLLDAVNNRLDSVNISQKSTKNITINGKLSSATNLYNDSDNLYITDPTGIYLVTKTAIDPKIVFSEQPTSINPTDFQFWNGAIYILDSSYKTIWKFAPNSSGFSKAQPWLKDDQKLEANPISFAINGKIWVLSKNGLITPYITGKKDNFTLAQTTAFTNTNNLVTTLDSEILAFTESDNMIYVYKKNGETVAKYNLDDKKIADIALNENGNLLYILTTDQKIYQINF